MVQVSSTTGRLEARLEDAEGRSWWNNVHRASGVDGPDWRTRVDSQVEGTAAQVVATDTDHRIEIQQDGTMALVTPGSANGSNGELEQGAERIPAHV
ncbi:hypothetical protein NDU88_000781 [Pleurodeles waltl]|uniref:Uncharacterized protein n=1 Tax=Pleurodeles waltl TaxID=8319 RepID=A0AAV7KMU2_PLEWA|nr:hypothetical protein NDU88_000781 [Pleurodeles waltl]